jgi:hypothetical protein
MTPDEWWDLYKSAVGGMIRFCTGLGGILGFHLGALMAGIWRGSYLVGQPMPTNDVLRTGPRAFGIVGGFWSASLSAASPLACASRLSASVRSRRVFTTSRTTTSSTTTDE